MLERMLMLQSVADCLNCKRLLLKPVDDKKGRGGRQAASISITDRLLGKFSNEIRIKLDTAHQKGNDATLGFIGCG